MTIFDLLKNPSYKNKGVLEKLICHRLEIEKQTLFTHADRAIVSDDLQRIEHAYKQYNEEKQPLEYILWHVQFAWITFHVSPATLIPRPETEYMIEAVREEVTKRKAQSTKWQNNSIHLLDIGTGCGVLWLSTLYHHHEQINQAILTDLSTDALAIAQQNYDNLSSEIGDRKSEIVFKQSNLLEDPLIKHILLWTNDVILVANLPYIPNDLFEQNTDDTVKKWEPKMAFVGGDDGLDLYRQMFDQLLDIWRPDMIMFLEMMTRQVELLRKEYEKHFSFEEVKTFHFNIRIVKTQFE